MIDNPQKRSFVGVTEAAVALGVSDQTVRNLCQRGELKFLRVNGKGARAILADDVRKLVEARRADE